MIENGILKVALSQTAGAAVPLVIVAIMAVLIWPRSARQRVKTLRNKPDSPLASPDGMPGSTGRQRKPKPPLATALKSVKIAGARSGAAWEGGSDRQGLLGQILTDNLRLREAVYEGRAE